MPSDKREDPAEDTRRSKGKGNDRINYRLCRTADFRRIFRNAQTTAMTINHVTVRTCFNTCGHPRLGITVSRKAAKRAVERNRIKRLIRESFRKHRTELPEIDVVVVCRPRCYGLSSAIWFATLSQVWRKLIRQVEMKHREPDDG